MIRTRVLVALTLMLLLVPALSLGSYYVSEESNFVSGTTHLVLRSSDTVRYHNCPQYAFGSGDGAQIGVDPGCPQHGSWTPIGGHKYGTGYPTTLVAHVSGQYRDRSTNYCMYAQTSILRYRMSSTYSEGTTCYPTSGTYVGSSISVAESTCSGSVSDTRDATMYTSMSFAHEEGLISSSQWRYYRERLNLGWNYGGSPVSYSQDGCYRVWWHS